jgi:hypothetical protein
LVTPAKKSQRAEDKFKIAKESPLKASINRIACASSQEVIEDELKRAFQGYYHIKGSDKRITRVSARATS